MRVAALYDIHGNLPALDATLAAIEQAGVDLIVLGGDIASGPMPRQTLDRLLGLGDRVRALRGNADRDLVATYDCDRTVDDLTQQDDPWRPLAIWAARQLTREQR